MRVVPLACGALLALGAHAVVPVAHAEPPPTRIQLQLDAPAECPSAGDLGREIVRRTDRVTVAEAGEGAAWQVQIRAERGLYVGRVRSGASRSAEAQETRSPRCRDVASAIALTIALTLDPDAKTDLVDDATPRDAPAPAPAAAPEPSPQPLAPRSADADRDIASPARARRWLLGAGASVMGAGMPAPWAGPWLSLESRSEGTALDVAARARVRLGFEVGDGVDRTVRTTSVALGLDLCVGRLAFARESFALSPCVGVEPGIVRGEGRNITGPTSTSALWMAVSGRVRIDVPLGDVFGLSVEGAAIFPVVRPRFYVDPTNATAAAASVAGAEGAIGVRMRFP
ncbi:MAG: hypothetical protein JST00_21070 [Deltaproteobacteria bacterium]|nr:hypothetical protein [Deltaproteobacteria bacterium]